MIYYKFDTNYRSIVQFCVAQVIWHTQVSPVFENNIRFQL